MSSFRSSRNRCQNSFPNSRCSYRNIARRSRYSYNNCQNRNQYSYNRNQYKSRNIPGKSRCRYSSIPGKCRCRCRNTPDMPSYRSRHKVLYRQRRSSNRRSYSALLTYRHSLAALRQIPAESSVRLLPEPDRHGGLSGAANRRFSAHAPPQ